MHESLRVDVVILSWNRIDDTLAALASACEQRGVDHHIYVVDQGSEPEHVAQLEHYMRALPNATLLKLERNIGVPAGRNLGTSLGTAPVIVALDSDAVFADSDVLLRAAERLAEQPELCAIGFAITNFFTGEPDWGSWDYPRDFDPAREFRTTRFVGAGHAIRRSSFEAVGGYDARLIFAGEELDLCYRMLNLDQRIVYWPSLAVLHKITTDHRVFWERGRYSQTVRNALYSQYKFGVSWPRLAVGAAAFLLRGMRNRITWQALRGVVSSIAMCWKFARSSENKTAYRLTPETWRYIRECEPTRQQSWLVKLRRQLVPLPVQSRDPRSSAKA
ncbi:MAG TPA: glycosyltransferase [Polyangiales bacterium]|nr:glycosyltransferase [Polyangiales bacterium]